MGLGTSRVIGHKRVPRPPARMTACIEEISSFQKGVRPPKITGSDPFLNGGPDSAGHRGLGIVLRLPTQAVDGGHVQPEARHVAWPAALRAGVMVAHGRQ